ncbi:MAG: hypothetical protein U0271_45835, partial [Polyangiaceae bacterium]
MSLAIALAVMVAASGAAPPTLALTSPARSQINDDVKDILSNKGYQFCNDRDHRLWPWERDYCPLLGTSNAACPEFPQVCKNELELTGDDELPTKPSSRMGNPDDAKDKDDRSKGKGDDEGKGDKEKEKEPEKLNLPEGVAFVLRILFFLFAAVFVGAIIWLIARSVMKGR